MNAVIKAIIFVVVVLTVVFYGGAYLLPSEARVERAIEIGAPAEKVFAIAGDLRRLPEWSPWREADPAMTFRFEGPEQGGPGQKLRWASNNPLVGNGTQTVSQYLPNEKIVIDTDYGDFGSSVSQMDFAPTSSGTRVTWRFRSALPGVIDRWAGLMIDGSVGQEYEKGLQNLKALVEKEPQSG